MSHRAHAGLGQAHTSCLRLSDCAPNSVRLSVFSSTLESPAVRLGRNPFFRVSRRSPRIRHGRTAFFRLSGSTRSSFRCGRSCVLGTITWHLLSRTHSCSCASTAAAAVQTPWGTLCTNSLCTNRSMWVLLCVLHTFVSVYCILPKRIAPRVFFCTAQNRVPL